MNYNQSHQPTIVPVLFIKLPKNVIEVKIFCPSVCWGPLTTHAPTLLVPRTQFKKAYELKSPILVY